MSRFKIERGADGKDIILVHGEPVGVITRPRHGGSYTCTLNGERAKGANGECVPGEKPAWAVKRARQAGLIGAGRLSAPRKRKPSDKLRDQERPTVFGYELDRETLTPKQTRLAPLVPAVPPLPAEIAVGARVTSLAYGDSFKGKVVGGAGRWVMVQWDGRSKPTEERAVDLQVIEGAW